MSSLDDFFASVECKNDTTEREPLTPEEIECTCNNLFKCSIEELKGDLFANLEKETGVGLFDFKSVITSSNTVNVDYLLLVSVILPPMVLLYTSGGVSSICLCLPCFVIDACRLHVAFVQKV